MTMKLSDLQSADEIHEQNMLDPEYRREYERTSTTVAVMRRSLTSCCSFGYRVAA